jgi:hypothetical protein
MEKFRKPVPDALATRLLVANRRTCCLCRVPGHELQIHHIDEDPANNEWENLAVLCLNCHGRVSGKPGFGRKFTVAELRAHKLDWETRCSGNHMPDFETDEDSEDDETTAETEHSEVRINPDEEYIDEFDLDEGDTLIVDLAADEFLDAYLCERHHYRMYERGADLKAFVAREDVRACRLRFEAPRESTYCLVLTHDCEDSVEVTIDTEVWPADADGDDQ